MHRAAPLFFSVLLLVPCGARAQSLDAVLGEAFSATDVRGRTVSVESLEGHIVLVDFWATWCAPCLAELPHLRTAYERFRARGFEIVGVSVDQMPRRDLLGFLRRHDIEWPQLHDGRGLEGPLATRFRVEAVPRSFLYDPGGRLVATDLGGKALQAVLTAMLAHPSLDR